MANLIGHHLTDKEQESTYNIKNTHHTESNAVHYLTEAKTNIQKMLKSYSNANDSSKGMMAKNKYNKEGNKAWKSASEALEKAYDSTDDVLIRRHIDQLSQNIKEYQPSDVYSTLDNLINVAKDTMNMHLHIQMKVQPSEEVYNKKDLLIFVDTQWTHQKPKRFYDQDGLTYYAYYRKDDNHYLIGSKSAKDIIKDPRFLFSERDKQMIKSRLDISGSTLSIKAISLEEAKARFAKKTNFY